MVNLSGQSPIAVLQAATSQITILKSGAPISSGTGTSGSGTSGSGHSGTGTSGSGTSGSGTSGTVPSGITIPPAALAAGLTNLAFNDDFLTNTYSATKGTTSVAGVNWSPYFWAAASKVTIANSIATIAGGNIGTTPSYAVSTGTGTGLRGSFFQGYFEARISFSPTASSTPAQGVWPGLWLYGLSAQSTQSTSFNCPEIDIFEAYPLGGTSFDPIQTLHNWLYPGNGGGDSETANTDSTNQMISLQGSTESAIPNDGAFHTYGCLWTNDSIQFYYDGFLVVHQNGTTSYKVGAGTSFPQTNAVSVILQGGTTQVINVDWVHVWN